MFKRFVLAACLVMVLVSVSLAGSLPRGVVAFSLRDAGINKVVLDLRMFDITTLENDFRNVLHNPNYTTPYRIKRYKTHTYQYLISKNLLCYCEWLTGNKKSMIIVYIDAPALASIYFDQHKKTK